ncbi:MAG: SH3 domain-containing protein [Christensenellales bacterium]
MKKFVTLLLALVTVFTLAAVVIEPVQAAASYSTVRVNLSVGSKTSLSVTLNGEYGLKQDSGITLPQGTYTIKYAASKLSIEKDGTVYYKGSAINLLTTKEANTITLSTMPVPYAYASNRSFRGDMQFDAPGSVIRAINTVYLEDYLVGVLREEIGTNRVAALSQYFAIAARGVAVSKINASKNKAYDVVDNHNDQMYGGYGNWSNLRAAVDATKGKIIYYNGSTVTVFYSASNGGQTELASNPFLVDLPYCVQKLDPYDWAHTGYKGSMTVNKNADSLNPTLEKAIKKYAVEPLQDANFSALAKDISIRKIDSIEAVNPRYPAPSISYRNFQMKVQVRSINKATGNFANKTITIQFPLAELSADANFYKGYSICRVEEESDSFTLYNARYGHSVGTSFAGAETMAKQGKTVNQILAFYMPGTNIAAVSVQKPAVYKPKALPSIDLMKGTPSSAVKHIGTAKQDGVVRKTASSAAEVISTFKKGDQMYVVQESPSGWYKLEVSGKTYYVEKTFLSLKDYNSSSVDTKQYIKKLPTGSVKQLGTAKRDMNVRVAASTSGALYKSLKKGQQLYVIQRMSNGWYQVEIDRKIYYTAGANLSVKNYTGATIKHVGTATANVNVRKSASTSGAVHTVLTKGKTVDVTADPKNGWCEVSISGKSYYVSAAYLQLKKVNPTVPTTTPTPPANPSGSSNVNASQYLTGTPTSAVKHIGTATLARTLRRSPSGTAGIYATLKKGQQVYVIGETTKGWYTVEVNRVRYYIDKAALSLKTYSPGSSSGGSSAASVKYVGTATVNVNVRKSASTSGAVYTVLVKGRTVDVMAEPKNGWCQVRINGGTYYVSASYLTLKKTNAAPAPTTPTTPTNPSGSSNVNASQYLTGTPTSAVKHIGTATLAYTLRRSPSGTAGIYATLKKGQQVYVIGETTKGWYTVEVNRVRYYIDKAALSLKTYSSGSSSGGSSAASVKYVGTATVNVNVRRSASTSGAIYTVLSKGRTVDVMAEPKNGWCQVRINGGTYYVSADYLLLKKAGAGSQSSVGTGQYLQSKPSSAVRYIGTLKEARTARKWASGTAAIYTTLKKGEQVYVIGESPAGWYMIEINGARYYVDKASLTLQTY